MRTTTLRRLRTVFLVPVLALLASAVLPSGASAQADQLAEALRSRNWWFEVDTMGDRPTGYVDLFGNPEGGGWYTGTRVTYVYGLQTTIRGFAWYPGEDWVYIDRASSVELWFFVDGDPDNEVFLIYEYFTGAYYYLMSTRSPYCPPSIQALWYR